MLADTYLTVAIDAISAAAKANDDGQRAANYKPIIIDGYLSECCWFHCLMIAKLLSSAKIHTIFCNKKAATSAAHKKNNNAILYSLYFYVANKRASGVKNLN